VRIGAKQLWGAIFAALPTRAPATSSATISLDVRPSRSAGVKVGEEKRVGCVDDDLAAPAQPCDRTMGIEAFAGRARRELAATGETVRKRSVETRDELTAQEGQIARLARDGLSNPEIGTRLFISRRTVQYHLTKVFAKLDISSRNQLHRAPSLASPIDCNAAQQA
jgi:DNA-binding CsgD family transcriptional regulator